MAGSGYICPECGRYTPKTLAHMKFRARSMFVVVPWTIFPLLPLFVIGVCAIAFHAEATLFFMLPLVVVQMLAAPLLAATHYANARVPTHLRGRMAVCAALLAFAVNGAAVLIMAFVLAQIAAIT